jgi:hypothetical protein
MRDLVVERGGDEVALAQHLGGDVGVAPLVRLPDPARAWNASA